MGPSVSYVRNQVTFYSLVSRKEIQNPNRLMGPRHISFSLYLNPSVANKSCIILTVLPLFISAWISGSWCSFIKTIQFCGSNAGRSQLIEPILISIVFVFEHFKQLEIMSRIPNPMSTNLIILLIFLIIYLNFDWRPLLIAEFDPSWWI